MQTSLISPTPCFLFALIDEEAWKFLGQKTMTEAGAKAMNFMFERKKYPQRYRKLAEPWEAS